MNYQQARLVARVIESHRRYSSACEYPLYGTMVKVMCDVFNPFLAPSGPLMIYLASSSIFNGKHVLDIGCGSGIASAALALKGGAERVVAIDINPMAVECARENAKRLGVMDRVEVREGDLFTQSLQVDNF
jgi:2-polyprenyl-3-methyl-5-hydroxy-6-metoxy-1,4-benzoquinol methylase